MLKIGPWPCDVAPSLRKMLPECDMSRTVSSCSHWHISVNVDTNLDRCHVFLDTIQVNVTIFWTKRDIYWTEIIITWHIFGQITNCIKILNNYPQSWCVNFWMVVIFNRGQVPNKTHFPWKSNYIWAVFCAKIHQINFPVWTWHSWTV